MRWRFANRASALIAATISTTDSLIHLEAGGGARMPQITGLDQFRATLTAADGTHEIVDAIALVGDVVEVDRGQEGTPAGTFPVGSIFEVRLTAGLAEDFLQRHGDQMLGPLDMNGFPIINATFPGSISIGVLHTGLIRSNAIPLDAPYNPTENAIVIPPNTNPTIDSRRPQYMGRVITNTDMFSDARGFVVFDWYGDVNNLPPHFLLMNGQPGTVDLRGKYIRGWTETFGVGGQGGAEVSQTTDDGAIGARVTDPTQLSIAHLPSHHHDVFVLGGTGGGTGSLGGATSKPTTDVGGNQPHNHGIPAVDAHHHLVQTQPPFYVLAKVRFAV